MEKLIELYNKHLQDRWLTHKCVEWEVRENINMLDQLKLFVKRLVDNDKIDLEKFEEVEKNIESIKFNVHYLDKSDIYRALLMLLSISDTPIELLISLLK